ncbi:UdgX family uracil-DNA binding protein [Mycobacterium sherrisii]|uniref:Type-4 uracil-DNA glycosylase n=1 Tax=Mycobacterium sherrisii TaxID=243061 RepID=A0A1E3SXD9_9MYCO|nr:UdgX family uracil-DNA binding protein [Mycobacterium sherrisii]MCV7029609.1 UdgX family uracil-DNA binding protein [Mycobacterium sherrisii]ODR06826.1 uracil-DNA glycosylase [Mycobacterium sherrisii]ORW83577.1 uracil-DNA glycosylase [Mycobacterium sherrisii]
MTATKPTAEPFLPAQRSLRSLQTAAEKCEGCSLFENATQTVFGHGKVKAPIMLIGEQPGDQEDRAGLPFVGPAGRLLAKALDDADIDPESTYQTNAVKHFKFTRKGGKRRIHQKPNRTEVVACRPWLLAEIDVIHPQVIVCLGATAAQSLLGASFRVSAHRGEVLTLAAAAPATTADEGPAVVATVHPSAVLRDRSDRRDDAYQAFVDDLRSARSAQLRSAS